MDKSYPHYNLKSMQALVQETKVRITSSAMMDAAALDYSSGDIKRIVLLLSDADFYKSMPSHKNAMI